MYLSNIKKFVSLSALFAGLASSSVLSAITFDCEPSQSVYKGEREIEEVSVKKRSKKRKTKKKDRHYFVTTQKCTVKGKGSVEYNELGKKYLKNMNESIGKKKEKKDFSKLSVTKNTQKDGLIDIEVDLVHEKPTEHGHMQIEADVTLQGTSNSFQTTYHSKYIDGEGNSGLTRKIIDKTELTHDDSGDTMVFTKEVFIKKPPIVDTDYFAKKVIEGLPDDMEKFVDLHERMTK